MEGSLGAVTAEPSTVAPPGRTAPNCLPHRWSGRGRLHRSCRCHRLQGIRRVCGHPRELEFVACHPLRRHLPTLPARSGRPAQARSTRSRHPSSTATARQTSRPRRRTGTREPPEADPQSPRTPYSKSLPPSIDLPMPCWVQTYMVLEEAGSTTTLLTQAYPRPLLAGFQARAGIGGLVDARPTEGVEGGGIVGAGADHMRAHGHPVGGEGGAPPVRARERRSSRPRPRGLLPARPGPARPRRRQGRSTSAPGRWTRRRSRRGRRSDPLARTGTVSRHPLGRCRAGSRVPRGYPYPYPRAGRQRPTVAPPRWPLHRWSGRAAPRRSA